MPPQSCSEHPAGGSGNESWLATGPRSRRNRSRNHSGEGNQSPAELLRVPSMIQITKKLTGRKYWRSLDQFYQTSEFQEWVNKEFPSTSDILDEPSRRNVLKVMAASFGLAGLTACRRPVEHI